MGFQGVGERAHVFEVANDGFVAPLPGALFAVGFVVGFVGEASAVGDGRGGEEEFAGKGGGAEAGDSFLDLLEQGGAGATAVVEGDIDFELHGCGVEFVDEVGGGALIGGAVGVADQREVVMGDGAAGAEGGEAGGGGGDDVAEIVGGAVALDGVADQEIVLAGDEGLGEGVDLFEEEGGVAGEDVSVEGFVGELTEAGGEVDAGGGEDLMGEVDAGFGGGAGAVGDGPHDGSGVTEPAKDAKFVSGMAEVNERIHGRDYGASEREGCECNKGGEGVKRGEGRFAPGGIRRLNRR